MSYANIIGRMMEIEKLNRICNYDKSEFLEIRGILREGYIILYKAFLTIFLKSVQV